MITILFNVCVFVFVRAYVCVNQDPQAVLQDRQRLVLHQLNPTLHPAVLHFPGRWGPHWPQVLQEQGLNQDQG